MSLGCAITHKKYADSEAAIEEGKRCMPFDNSGRVILSVTDYKEKIKKEIACVKALKNPRLASGFWIASVWRGGSTATTKQ